MVDRVDMSLDEIIKSNRSAFKTGRGGASRGGPRRSRGGARVGGGGGGNNNRNVGGGPRKSFSTGAGRKFAPRGPPMKKTNAASGDRWLHDKFRGSNGAGGSGGAGMAASKLTVSNLHYGVSDDDIKELFNEFGTLKKAAVHYDRSGRSLGTADVIFERRSDALRAMKQYNDVPLDGRPMKIELSGDKPANPVGGGRVLAGRIGKRPAGKSPQKPQQNSGGPPRGNRNGPAGKGGRGGARKAPPKKTPTREQLDAELDAYVSKMDTV